MFRMGSTEETPLTARIIKKAFESGFDKAVLASAHPFFQSGSLLLLAKGYTPYGPFPKESGVLPGYYPLSHSLHAVTRDLADWIREQGCPAVPNPAIPLKLAAYQAGLGVYGKNSLLYVPGYGSFMHLRAIHLGIPFAGELPVMPSPETTSPCGECRRCQEACPTGAIQDSGQVCGPLCLREVLAGKLPEDRPLALKLLSRADRMLVGCEICQRVCPMNQEIQAYPLQVPDELASLLHLPSMMAESDAAWRHRIQQLAALLGTNIARPRRLKANAALACSTLKEPGDISTRLREYLESPESQDLPPAFRKYLSGFTG
ncbi:MAG TPA: hypothetical protein DD727_09860 [Clostridiales bacterium]|nr:hypothetical protein [Clostridiales bacterium]